MKTCAQAVLRWAAPLALALSFLLAGCGPAALPDPAKRSVTDADLLGAWSYRGNTQKTRVEIQFSKDGTFAQTVTGANGVSKSQKGAWSLDGPWVRLRNVLLNQSISGDFSPNQWKPEDTTWWFTDVRGRLDLMGGEKSSDPDNCQPLLRIPAAKGGGP